MSYGLLEFSPRSYSDPGILLDIKYGAYLASQRRIPPAVYRDTQQERLDFRKNSLKSSPAHFGHNLENGWSLS